MTKATFTRKGNALYPLDDEALEVVRAIKEGSTCIADVRGARNIRQLRLYNALLKMLVEGGVFENRDDADLEIKTAIHAYDTFVNKDGIAFHVPKSFSFQSMDATEFKRYFDRIIWVVVNKYLPMTDGALRDELLKAIDGPQAIGSRVVNLEPVEPGRNIHFMR